MSWRLSRQYRTRHPLVERYPNLRLLKKPPSVPAGDGSDYVTPTETVAAAEELHPSDVVLLYFNAPGTLWCEGCKDVNEKLVRFVKNFSLEHTRVPRHERVMKEFVEQHPGPSSWGAHIGPCPRVRVVFVNAVPKEGDAGPKEGDAGPKEGDAEGDAEVGRRARSAVGEEWKNYWINSMPSDWLAVDVDPHGTTEAGTIPGGENLPSAHMFAQFMLRDLVPEPEGHIPALWAVYRSPTAAPPSRQSREQAWSPSLNSPNWSAFYFQPDNDQDWDAFVTKTAETVEKKWKAAILFYPFLFDQQRARVHADDIVVLYFPPVISGGTTEASSPYLRGLEFNFLTSHVRAFARQLNDAVLMVQTELANRRWLSEVVVPGDSSSDEGVDDGASHRGRLAEPEAQAEELDNFTNRWTLVTKNVSGSKAEFRVRVVFAASSPSGTSGEMSRAVFDDFARGAGWLYADRALFDVEPVPQALQALDTGNAVFRDEDDSFRSIWRRGRAAEVFDRLDRAYETVQVELRNYFYPADGRGRAPLWFSTTGEPDTTAYETAQIEEVD
eukprot:g7428.t1